MRNSRDLETMWVPQPKARVAIEGREEGEGGERGGCGGVLKKEQDVGQNEGGLLGSRPLIMRV